MLKSMTGFGLATGEYKSSKITVEIKSLNSKFLELTMKLPKAYMQHDMLIRAECQKMLERGKLMVTINLDSDSEISSGRARIDKGLLLSYYRELEALAVEVKSNPTDLLGLCLNLPNVVNMKEQEECDEAEWAQIYETFKKAVAALDAFRAKEGNILHIDIESRIFSILAMLDTIEIAEKERVPTIKNRIYAALEQKMGKIHIDMNRLEQELIYYIEKLDITEEKVRLKSHCNYFIETLTSNEANGKKLGFIGMEIGREINTIGSKVNDAAIQQKVILMKDELEKIKEQLLNIL